jgi:Ca2+-binding EF-hand superfamily protein
MREEFIDFAQFMAVMNFLSTTVEGQQVALASQTHAEQERIKELIAILSEDPSKLSTVVEELPLQMAEEVKGTKFANLCKEAFLRLDKQRTGTMDVALFVPEIMRMSKEFPISLDKQTCKSYVEKFDVEKFNFGTLRIGQVVELTRFVVVLAYLVACSEWHDANVKQSKTRIEEMLAFLKAHKDKIDDIIPFLPPDLKEELISQEFADMCAEEFRSVDTDKSGVLEPKELIPLILQLSEGHKLALTYDHVLEFVSIFDTLKNGVLTLGEYVNFARFMVIVAYLESAEGQATSDAALIEKDKQKVEELLNMLQNDRRAIHKVVPLLPAEIFDAMTSSEFITQCQERFEQLDADKNGTLEPKELYPVVVEISQAHPFSIDLDHCLKFTKIFDVHGDGVIRSDEFMDFARFLCVMSYLQSEEGKNKANDALKIMDESQQIEDLIAQLKQDKRQMRKVIPYLPEDLQDELLSKRFASKCLDKFRKLDKDDNGTLDHAELIPIIMELVNATAYALDMDQCKRFVAIFDDEKTGVISRQEFVNFARFLMVMSYLQTEDGKKTSQTALAAYDAEKKRKREAKQAREQNASRGGSAGGEIVAASQLQHVTVELEFYQNKSAKLKSENDVLRNRLFEIEEKFRRMENSMEEQRKLLKHAEIELSGSGKNWSGTS